MKGFATLLLMLLLLTQTFGKWMWVLEYELNKTYIAQNLCINKSKPQLHCNGSCQLSKKLAEDEKNNTASGPLAAKKEFNPVFFTKDLETVSCPWRPLQKREPFYIASLCTSILPSVFHPPAV